MHEKLICTRAYYYTICYKRIYFINAMSHLNQREEGSFIFRVVLPEYVRVLQGVIRVFYPT